MKQFYATIVVLFAVCFNSLGQKGTIIISKQKADTVADHPPEFPGGESSISKIYCK
jgi:hypothetical protein